MIDTNDPNWLLPVGNEHVEQFLSYLRQSAQDVVDGLTHPLSMAVDVWTHLRLWDTEEVNVLMGCFSEADETRSPGSEAHYTAYAAEIASQIVAGTSESLRPGGRERLLALHSVDAL